MKLLKRSLYFLLLLPSFLVQAQAPTTGASNFSVTNNEGNSLRVNWTRGNGSRLMVVASTSSTFSGTGVPADGTDYTPNTTFGSGNTIGTGNFVVYEGTATNVTVTGLVNATIYYFRIYEFNGTGTGTQYNTANVLAGNGTTLSPPTTGSTTLIATPTGNSASLTWTRGNGTRSLVILQAGSATTDPTQYVNYSASATFGSGTAIGSGRVVYFNTSNTVNVTNLAPNTQYFYRVVEGNGTSGPVYNLATALVGSFTTGGAPTTGATTFSVSNIEGNSLRVNWTRGNGSNVLVVASTSSTFGGTGVPADGTDYNPNTVFGSGNTVGTDNFAVYEGTATNVTVTGLVQSTTYYFRIYEFNGTGTGTLYTANVLAGNGTTLLPPTTGSTSLIATPTGNSASLTWTRGNGTRSLVILQAGSATTDPTQYVNYSASATFGSGTAIGTGRVVYFNTSNTVNVTNLEPNTQYFYRVVEGNGTSGPVYNLATALVGSFTTGGAPTTGATTFSVSNIDGNRLTVNWTRGNGSNVLVVASLSSTFSGSGNPANGTDYVENTAFGSGDPIGTGNFVVYRNTGNSVTITGLVLNTTYYFRIYEFNGINFNTVYNTTNVLAGSGTTLSPPTVGSTNLIATPTGNSASLTWTRGNGTRSLVILQQGSATIDPVQYTNYSPSTSFGSGSAVGSGRVVHFSNTSTPSINVTNLIPGTVYFYRVVESNGASGPVFGLANALTGSFTTQGAPTLGSTAFTTPSIEGNSFSRSFTAGNGTNRLIVARQDLPVAFVPTNGVDYNASSVFGNGDNLGSNTFVVGETPGSFISLTNLTPATTYHLAIFEFNGTASNTFYLTDVTKVLTGSVTTLSPPSASAGNFIFTDITGYNATVTFTAGNGVRRLVLAKAGSPVTDVPVSLVNYTSSNSFSSAPALGASKIVYEGSGTTFIFSTLQPNTTYHFAIFEYNGSSGPVYKQADPGIGSFVTLGKPTTSPTNLSFSNIQGNQMTLSYTTGNGFGRIVIAKQGSPVDVFPTDLTSYTESSVFGTAAAHLGGGNYVIDNNASIGGNTSTGISGLSVGLAYHFAIIEYNGTGTERIYMTSAQALAGNSNTLSAPTVQATNVTFSNITSNTLTVNWQNGNGNGRMVLIREGQAVQSLPVNLVNYSSTSFYPSSPSLGTSKIVYEGTGNSVNITSIPPGTYHVAVVEYNGTTGQVYRTADPLIGVVNVGDKPPIPASNLSFSNIEGNSMQLNLTAGNGLSRMIVAKLGSPVDAWPVDFTGYTASGNFGSGANLGGGNFVVGSSNASNFGVSNLAPNSTYHFAVVEFNGTGATAFYQLPSIVATASRSTLTAPTVTTSSFFANSIIGNSMQLTWTRGDGTSRLIIARAGAAVDVIPANLSNPFSSSSFGSGTNYGGGNFAVYDGTSDNFNLTNLEPGTTYHFAFFEFNGTSGPVYLTNSIGRASFTTAPRPSVAARNLTVSSVNGDRFNLSFTSGNGTRRLVVLRKGGLVSALPVDLTTYTSGSFGAGTLLANGNYATTFSAPANSLFTVQGLEPDTEYGVAVFEVDGSNGNQRYLVTEYINQLVKTASAPTVSTSSLLFNSLGSTSVSLSWTNGNGEGRMVVLRPLQPSTFTPTVLSTHGSSSSDFTSTFNNLPNSHKHMYRGAATTVTLTNLSPATTYHLALFEYNGSGQPVYTSVPLTGFFTTLPTSGIAIGGFDAITFCPAQQVDVPYVHTGLLNAGNVLSVELSDIAGSFATPTILGTQSTTNTSGFITSTLPTSVTEGLGYRLRVRATNPASLSANNGADLQITTSVQPTFTVIGGQVSSCGTPIQLTTSQPNYNLQWFRNAVAIPGATSSSYFASQTGNYQVRISGASGGCQLLSTATTITITQEPAFNFLFAASYCVNDVINLVPLSQPASGILSGPGIVNGVFNAATAGVGQHLITYTYVDAVSLCSFSKTTQILVTALPGAPTTTDGSACQLTGISLVASGATVTESYKWYSVASGGTPIAGATLATFTTPPLTTTTSYYVSIVSAAGCEGPRAEAIATVKTVAAPTATGASGCPGIFTLSASGGTNGQYRWYSVATGGTAIAGEVNSSYATPSLSATTSYYVSINNGTCESTRTMVTATLVNVSPPTVTNATLCGTGSATLSASGGSNGQYRWYTASTGGTAVAGEVNSSYTTPSLSATTSYYVSINNGTCESARTSVTATINALPTKPMATSTPSATSGTVTICSTASVILSAPNATSYLWSSGETTQQITTSKAGTYTVVIKNTSGCASPSSDAITIIVNNCNSEPPIIAPSSLVAEVGGKTSLSIPQLIEKIENVDLATLKITKQPASGATAIIDGKLNLVVDYNGISFVGQETLTIQGCNFTGTCVEQVITIDVGTVIAYNGISANGDSKNAILLLKYIDVLQDTKRNTVSVYNRWGDRVFQVDDYDNSARAFTGKNQDGADLPADTYFYKIEYASGRKTQTGYLSLKR